MDDLDGFIGDDPLATWDLLLEAVRDPVFIHDPKGRLVRFNQAYLDCCLEPVETLIGQPYWHVFPKRELPLHGCRALLHHDHERRPEEEQAVEDLLLETGELLRSHAIPLFDSEGEFCYAMHILSRSSAFPLPGPTFRFLNASLEQSVNPTLLLDTAGHAAHANPALLKLIGMDGAEISGLPLERLGVDFPGERDGDAQFGALLRYGHWQGEVSIRARAGQPENWRASITAVSAPDGVVAGFTAILFNTGSEPPML